MCQTCVEPHTSEPLRLESQMDTSDMRAHTPGTTNESRRSENTSECVRTPQNSWTNTDSPGTSTKSHIEEPQRPGNHANEAGRRTHAHSNRIDAIMAVKISQTVSIPQNSQKPPNSPISPQNWCISGVDDLWNHTKCRALQWTQTRLTTRAETSENARGSQGGQTHLIGSKLKHSSVLDDGDTSAIKKATRTHRETCQSKPWTCGEVVDVIVVGVVVAVVDVGRRGGRRGHLQECY